MKMLRKIIDCESLEDTQGNVYDGVYLSCKFTDNLKLISAHTFYQQQN